MSDLFLATPLINASYLSSFPDKTVKIVGKVKSLGEVATIDASGDVLVHLAPDAHLQEGKFYEFIGRVNNDLSLKMLSTTQTEFSEPISKYSIECGRDRKGSLVLIWV